MSTQKSSEERLLAQAERPDVAVSHYPEILKLSREELAALIKRLRDHRDRAQSISRQQRREMRGKADARGAQPARDSSGSIEKAQLLSQAVKRANKELARHDEPKHEPSPGELARKAFDMRQAARITQHPSGGWTSGRGMVSKPSKQRTVQMDRREIGRVSQAIKVAQAKRDG